MPKLFALAMFIMVSLANCTSKSKTPESVATAGEQTTSQQPYHRFYQGYRLNSVSPDQFENIINTQFLPLFPQAHPLGLKSYRPALPKRPAGCSLPSEIALLTFENEKVYGSYRDTEIGKKIRDAHTLVFNAETSKSLVPEKFEGSLQLNHAYNLKNDFNNYYEAESALVIHCNPRSSKDILPELAKNYVQGSSAENIIFATTPQHLVEYVFVKTAGDLKAVTTERSKQMLKYYKKSVVIILNKQKIGSTLVTAGHGVNAQW